MFRCLNIKISRIKKLNIPETPYNSEEYEFVEWNPKPFPFSYLNRLRFLRRMEFLTKSHLWLERKICSEKIAGLISCNNVRNHVKNYLCISRLSFESPLCNYTHKCPVNFGKSGLRDKSGICPCIRRYHYSQPPHILLGRYRYSDSRREYFCRSAWQRRPLVCQTLGHTHRCHGTNVYRSS